MIGPGVLSISVDAQFRPSRSLVSAEAVESVLIELEDRLNKRQVPATWAFADPAIAPLARRLAGQATRHEVALLSESLPLPQASSRGYLAEAVIRPIQAAQRAGMSITTLATTGPWQPEHVDLLSKYGISIIRGPRTISPLKRVISRHQSEGVQTVCSGLWHVPVTTTFRGGGWMANLRQLAVVRRAVARAAESGSLCHLRIDAGSLAVLDVPSGLRTVERLLRHIQTLCEAGRLSVETLSDTAARLRPKRGVAAQSILRAA